MSSRKRLHFKVSLTPPLGATVADVREFIDDAVGCWAGQCRPPGALCNDDEGDPMYAFDSKTLRVTQIKSKKPRSSN